PTATAGVVSDGDGLPSVLHRKESAGHGGDVAGVIGTPRFHLSRVSGTAGRVLEGPHDESAGSRGNGSVRETGHPAITRTRPRGAGRRAQSGTSRQVPPSWRRGRARRYSRRRQFAYCSDRM